jgi:RNA polymerase sigma-70 factor (ECF subfamily)
MKTNVQLITEQMSYFRAIARKSLPSRYQYLAEDLAQDAIIKAIAKVHLYDPTKGNFKSWLYRLTQNVCFDAIRKMQKMDYVPLNSQILYPDHQQKDVNRSDLRKIRKSLQYLCERDRMLITYRFMFNLSGKEMAQLMNIPEAQINVYFKRAKEKLKQLCQKAA